MDNFPVVSTFKKKKNRFSKNATPCLIPKIGTWLDNLQDGVGIAIYSNGDRFEGVWREGQLVLGFGFKTESSSNS